MPTPPLPPELQELLAKPNPSVIATLRSDGSPVTVATWYLWEDGQVHVSMDKSRVRLKHMRRDSRVAITVLDGDSWYSHVSLIGRVARLEDDEGLAHIDRIARHYRGGEYPVRDRERVSAWIEVERWHAWGP
jgi:PPOX class probable F420-dependent enzyme